MTLSPITGPKFGLLMDAMLEQMANGDHLKKRDPSIVRLGEARFACWQDGPGLEIIDSNLGGGTNKWFHP